jgi:biotin carboxyl carrier protein
MPGRVIAIHVEPGAAVATGAAVLTLEAMKMEHAVAAPGDGTLTSVLVGLGEQVERGQTLATGTLGPPTHRPGSA